MLSIIVTELLRTHEKKEGIAMVLKEEIIEIKYTPEDENGKKLNGGKKKLLLKKVCYQDEKNRYYEFISNNMEISAEEIAFLYKKR